MENPGRGIARVAPSRGRGSVAARKRHVARGKLLPHDRVARLIDPGSPFLELSQLAAFGQCIRQVESVHAAGIITER